MKLLDIADFFSERGGGIRSYLTSLAAEGHRRGHEVVVVAPGPRNETLPFGGGRLVRLAGPATPYDRSYNVLWRIDRVLEIVDAERPDVLQASSPYLPALLAGSRRDVPVRSLVFHSDQVSTYVRPLVERIGKPGLTRATLACASALHRALSRRFDVTIAPSRSVGLQLREAGCRNVRCVAFGVELAHFGAHLARQELRRRMLGRFASDPRAAVAVVSCRLAVEKRVARVIDAVSLVNQTRPLALAIAGDGPERRSLEKHARKLPQVEFLGFVKDRSEYASLLASGDVFVHGGAAETFGFVLAEAIASGLGLVVPSAGAATDYVIDGVTEAYPAYGTVPEMADAIHRSLDVPRASRMNALAAASLPFRTQAAHFDELFALYESMLGVRRESPAAREQTTLTRKAIVGQPGLSRRPEPAPLTVV